MLDTACISYDLNLTLSEAQVTRFIEEQDLAQYSMLMIVSGDGLLHVLLNALFKKVGDEVEFLDLLQKLPFAIIPAGTSNGLSATLNFENAYEATRHAIEGTINEIDIFQIYQTQTQTVQWDCGTFCWSMPAEHDHYQERVLRWIPFSIIRDILAPLIVIFLSKSYNAVLTLQLAPTQNPLYTTDITKIEGSFGFFLITNIPRVSPDILLSPHLKIDEGAVDLVVAMNNLTRWDMIKLFLKMSDGSYLKSDKNFLFKVKGLTLDLKGNPGYMSSSGEALVSQSIKLKVYERAARIVYIK